MFVPEIYLVDQEIRQKPKCFRQLRVFSGRAHESVRRMGLDAQFKIEAFLSVPEDQCDRCCAKLDRARTGFIFRATIIDHNSKSDFTNLLLFEATLPHMDERFQKVSSHPEMKGGCYKLGKRYILLTNVTADPLSPNDLDKIVWSLASVDCCHCAPIQQPLIQLLD